MVSARVHRESFLLIVPVGDGIRLPRSQPKLGSLQNPDGEAEDKVDYKMNLYFTCESLDSITSFTLFIAVKTIAKLNLELGDKFGIEIKKKTRRG